MGRTLFIVILSFLPMLSQAQKKAVPTSYMLIGKQIYSKHCMACHQVDGTGAQNMIPPLIRTEYTLGSKAMIIKILLNGMNGEIKVNGDTYSNEMPSFAFLSDDEIASVLTYVRKNFENNASTVTPKDVRKVRAANKVSISQ